MKRILSFILIVCIFFLSTYCAGASSNPAVTEVKFTSGEERISYLSPGETVTASITAENFTAGDKAIFVLLLYRENKMIDLTAEVHTFEEENSAEFKAELTMPDDITDCRVEAVLWDGIDTMMPLCTCAIFPGTENRLKDITVNGESVEGFDPDVTEYECIVDTYSTSSPEISVDRMDGSAAVSVKSEKTFPGKSIVTVKSTDESETVYTINYKSREDTETLITNFDVSDCTIRHNLAEGSAVYSAEEYVDYVNLPGKLKGASYIVPDGQETTIEGSFALKRTAQVMILNSTPLSLDEQWTEDTSLSAQRYRAVSAENEGYGAYDELLYGYTKTVSVEGEPVDVELPALDATALVAVKFVYDEISGAEIMPENPRVTNLRYHGPTNADGIVAQNTHPVYGTGFADGSLLYTNYTLECADLAEEYVGDDYIIVQNPISGANPANTKSAWYGETATWITFEVRQNVTIRAFTNGKIDALTWAGGFTEETVSGSVYLNRYNPQYPDSKTAHDRMYTKYVEASEESPVTVKIPNAAFTFATKWAYVLTLDFEE